MSQIAAPTPSIAAPLRHDRTSSITHRLIAAFVALASAGILAMAAYLTPSPTGLGTHQALNLPPCSWIVLADLPCPTCGMTTAFSHAAHGNLLASFQAQPMGSLLALATAMALILSVYIVVTGSRIGRAFLRLWSRAAAWSISIMVVAAWGYKILIYKGWL